MCVSLLFLCFWSSTEEVRGLSFLWSCFLLFLLIFFYRVSAWQSYVVKPGSGPRVKYNRLSERTQTSGAARLYACANCSITVTFIPCARIISLTLYSIRRASDPTQPIWLLLRCNVFYSLANSRRYEFCRATYTQTNNHRGTRVLEKDLSIVFDYKVFTSLVSNYILL